MNEYEISPLQLFPTPTPISNMRIERCTYCQGRVSFFEAQGSFCCTYNKSPASFRSIFHALMDKARRFQSHLQLRRTYITLMNMKLWRHYFPIVDTGITQPQDFMYILYTDAAKQITEMPLSSRLNGFSLLGFFPSAYYSHDLHIFLFGVFWEISFIFLMAAVSHDFLKAFSLSLGLWVIFFLISWSVRLLTM